ncbi:MAG: phosphopyruvate hydratase [Methanosarcinales archaeon]|nr:MAG: phosphopyruvate hydratase [Methanosarcinales archaeon]
MTKITSITVRTILDSRGNKTIEADVCTANGFGQCAAPSGASTGTFEARSIPASEAVLKARKLVIPELIGLDATEQEKIDAHLHKIDGTNNFANIGGNTAVAISLAVAKAAASSSNSPLYRYLNPSASALPFPLGNVIGGGAHAKGATDIQEFLVIPVGAKSVQDAIFANALVHKKVKMILEKKGVHCGKGDEGAWAPPISDVEALEIISEAIKSASDSTGFEIRAALDVAATELWNGSTYVYADAKRSPEEQIEYISQLIDEHNLYFVEDPLEENDFEGFVRLTERAKCLICGDDLFVTNSERIKKGIEMGAANAVLIKPNQIGTLTDTYNAMKLAKEKGYCCIISHRSGETLDETIAHLAVAFDIPIIKTGVVGGERIAKLNELIRIEEEMSAPRMASITY